MRTVSAVSLAITLPIALSTAACGSAPGGEVAETSAAPLVETFTGFMLFGGTANECLAVSGALQAGASLMSATCNVESSAQGWRLMNPAGGDWIQIALEANPALCIDNSFGAPRLAACAGLSSYSFDYQNFTTVGSKLQALSAPQGGAQCFGVASGQAGTGQTIELQPCNGSLEQTAIPWGVPLNLVSESSWICLSNSGLAQIMGIGQCQQSSSAFLFTTGNQILQWVPVVGVGTNGVPYGGYECLSVYGFNGTTSLTQLQPCSDPVPATQAWTVRGSVIESEALVTTTVGRFHELTTECLQDDGSLDACNGGGAQLWALGYVP